MNCHLGAKKQTYSFEKTVNGFNFGALSLPLAVMNFYYFHHDEVFSTYVYQNPANNILERGSLFFVHYTLPRYIALGNSGRLRLILFQISNKKISILLIAFSLYGNKATDKKSFQLEKKDAEYKKI